MMLPLAEGEQWKTLRAAMSPAFSTRKLKVVCTLIELKIPFALKNKKRPFVLKLRTCSFICTYCYDPTMPIMGPERGGNGTEMGPKIVNIADNIWWPSVATNCIP